MFHKLKPDSMCFERLSHSGLTDLLAKVKPEDMRPIDFLEWNDAIEFAGLGKFVTKENFNHLLGQMMGCHYFSVNVVHCYYMYKHKSEYITQSAFVASSFAHPQKAHHLLICGFGWDKADNFLSKRQKIEMGKWCCQELLINDSFINRWSCLIHKDNTNTLQTWRFMRKWFIEVLDITEASCPNNKDYIEVVITRRRRINRENEEALV